MTTEISSDRLIKLLQGQIRSTQMWIDQYNRFKDAAGVRNAAMGIGKVAGIFNVFCSLGIDVPDDIQQEVERMMDVWANLEVK